MSWEQLKKLNKQINEAKWATIFATNTQQDIELNQLRKEKIYNKTRLYVIKQMLKGSVKRYRELPGLAINRWDIIKYRNKLRIIGMPEDEIQAMIGDALDIKPIEQNKLSKEELELKLQQLKTHIKSYMDDLEFKASLDPTFSLPNDMITEIETWESQDGDVNFSTIQTKILRAKRNLQSAGVSIEIINLVIRNP